MRIQQLRTFVVVARCRSYSTAAQELLYSESSVGYHIRELEKALGARLFSRDDNRLELTTAGRAIAGLTSDLVARADELATVISAVQRSSARGAARRPAVRVSPGSAA